MPETTDGMTAAGKAMWNETTPDGADFDYDDAWYVYRAMIQAAIDGK